MSENATSKELFARKRAAHRDAISKGEPVLNMGEYGDASKTRWLPIRFSDEHNEAMTRDGKYVACNYRVKLSGDDDSLSNQLEDLSDAAPASDAFRDFSVQRIIGWESLTGTSNEDILFSRQELEQLLATPIVGAQTLAYMHRFYEAHKIEAAVADQMKRMLSGIQKSAKAMLAQQKGTRKTNTGIDILSQIGRKRTVSSTHIPVFNTPPKLDVERQMELFRNPTVEIQGRMLESMQDMVDTLVGNQKLQHDNNRANTVRDVFTLTLTTIVVILTVLQIVSMS